MNAIKRISLYLVPCALYLGIAVAHAQQYPNRPIRLIMPNAPGSSTDTMGRIAATKLGDALGQQLVVDNRAGAGGVLGLEIGKNAAPDGYTLIVTSLGALTVSPHIRKNLPYDPIKDYEYVATYSRQGNVLVVNPTLPIKSVKDLIAFANAKQGKIFLATAGVGAQSHLNGAQVMLAGKFDSVVVPYKGGGPSMSAVIANEAQWSIAPSGATMSHIRAGRVRGIGHTLPTRSPLMGDIPPIAETLPGYKYIAFSGILAPKNTPKAIVQKLNATMAKVVASPEMRDLLAQQGAEPVTMTPEEFRKAIAAEIVETGKVVRAIGLKAD